MELRWHLDRSERRQTDWFAAGVAGLAASAVLMVMELAWAATMNADGPWRIAQLVAALTLGPELALQPPMQAFDTAVVATALATHYALGVAFGLLLGLVVAGFHVGASLGAMEVIGAAFGLALYVINFYGIALAMPWMAELRGFSALIAHLAYGITASILYWRLARRGHVGPASH